MTREQAIKQWKDQCVQQIKDWYEQDGIPDYPARCESWNEFTDELCKDGYITLKQYSTWAAPRECVRK